MSPNYVVDANVLFSAFISGREVYQLFFAANKIYLPDYAFSEIDEYRDRILQKAKLPLNDLKEYVLRLLKNVTVIPAVLISNESLQKAKELCETIDEKDTMYVAIALEFDCTLITNDKKLYKGLKDKNAIEIETLSKVLHIA